MSAFFSDHLRRELRGGPTPISESGDEAKRQGRTQFGRRSFNGVTEERNSQGFRSNSAQIRPQLTGVFILAGRLSACIVIVGFSLVLVQRVSEGHGDALET